MRRHAKAVTQPCFLKRFPSIDIIVPCGAQGDMPSLVWACKRHEPPPRRKLKDGPYIPVRMAQPQESAPVLTISFGVRVPIAPESKAISCRNHKTSLLRLRRPDSRVRAIPMADLCVLCVSVVLFRQSTGVDTLGARCARPPATLCWLLAFIPRRTSFRHVSCRRRGGR